MSQPVLIDTSYWIEFFNRPDTGSAKRVRTLIREDRAAVNGIVLAELLQGVRTDEEASELRLALEATVYLETSREIYTRAGALGFELRRRGVTVPVTDCLITAVAESTEASILTLDQHLTELAQVASVGVD